MKTQITLLDYLAQHFAGVSSARRLILSGAVSINGVVVGSNHYNFPLQCTDIIRVGKHWSASII